MKELLKVSKELKGFLGPYDEQSMHMEGPIAPTTYVAEAVLVGHQ
jgi:hypothetical protein